jgi:transcriptional regulator with XRE-family HTH domain
VDTTIGSVSEMKNLAIGTHLRKIRIRQNRTIQEIADKCKLSRSMISKIETNKVVPSVSTLVKLARSLGTDVSALLEENGDLTSVLTHRGQVDENMTRTDRGYRIYPFAAAFKNKKMQPFFFVAQKREVKEHHLTHEGEEFIYVLEGSMKFQVGDVEYVMKEGDSLYFDSLEKHQVVPISDTVKYLDVFV